MTRITKETAVELARQANIIVRNDHNGTGERPEKVQALCQAAIDWAAKQGEAEPFIVKHYQEDERPIIKGNGFDGLELGSDRQEAEEFITWVNARLTHPVNQEHGELVRRLRKFSEDGVGYSMALCDEAADALEGKL